MQTAGTGAIFTRRLDFDTSSDITNTGAIPVVSGTVNGTTSWVVTSAVTTVGTDPLTFTQFSVNPTTVLISGGALGTPSSGTATNLSGTAASLTAGNVTTNANLTGDVTSSGNASTVVLSVAHNWTGQQTFAAAALTDASPITWNLATQQAATVLLTSGVGGTRQLANPTNMVNGGTYTLKVTQSSTGSNALTYDNAYKWPGGTAPTLSTANNAVDILTFLSDGSSMFGVSQLAFS